MRNRCKIAFLFLLLYSGGSFAGDVENRNLEECRQQVTFFAAKIGRTGLSLEEIRKLIQFLDIPADDRQVLEFGLQEWQLAQAKEGRSLLRILDLSDDVVPVLICLSRVDLRNEIRSHICQVLAENMGRTYSISRSGTDDSDQNPRNLRDRDREIWRGFLGAIFYASPHFAQEWYRLTTRP